MELAKFIVFSFGFGGVMLVVFCLIFKWFLTVHLPKLEADREDAYKASVALLTANQTEERKNCREERAEAHQRFNDALLAQVEDRRDARKDYTAALDRNTQAMVALAAEVRGNVNPPSAGPASV